MAQFESRRTEIEAAGSNLAFVAAEKRAGVWRPERFLEKHPISSVFLLDEDRTVTKSYGLHNPLATDAINIAHPATLIISRGDGDRNDDSGAAVRYIYRGDNQLDRASLDEVLETLKQINLNLEVT
jgi:peroxiredoxin